MDWFPPNAKKELLIVPQEAKMMIVNMEMYAPHENWNLKNPFPGESGKYPTLVVKPTACPNL